MSLNEAITAFKAGKPVIIMDDDTRENEGDLCLPANVVTDSDVLFFLRHSTGMLCVATSPSRVDKLKLPMMISENTDPQKTPFTVSVDLARKHGTTTGVSAQDKAKTIRALGDPKMTGQDFSKPGHIFPLRASPQGLYGRQGHTEASVELCKLAGLYPTCMIAELMNSDGTMSRLKECREFGKQHNIPIITVKDIQNEISMTTATLPISFPETVFQISTFSPPSGERYVILSRGEVKGKSEVPVRIHSECLTGDVFRSARCDCGSQLENAMKMFSQLDLGLLIYVRGQEGRGIGLENKIKAYELQDYGNHDTYSANKELHLPLDCRNYDGINMLLEKLEVKSIVLFTENPTKIESLAKYISKTSPFPGTVTPQNQSYLNTKSKMVTSTKKIGLAYTTAWHKESVDHMVKQCRAYLDGFDILEKSVSGSFELIMGAQNLFDKGCQSVIILGILLKGDTYHFEAIVSAVGHGVMSLQLAQKKPIIYGVLTCYTQEQIKERVFGDKNSLQEWCKAAIEMTA